MIDVWNYITSFIERDKDKCNLLMTSQKLSNCKVFFNEMINIDVINKSKWFHQFTNILTNELITLPKNLKILNFADRFNGPINNYVPHGVVHLSFGYMFNQPLYECIPSSVTHLEFRDKKINNNIYHSSFSYSLANSVPSSVKYLLIDSNITNCNDIDKLTSITHMTINRFHGQKYNNIPPSVSHLTINNCYVLTNMFPSSVTHLTLMTDYGSNLKHYIPTSVKKIYFHNINKHFQKRIIIELRGLNAEIEFL